MEGKSAFTAWFNAQKIALGPIMFQAALQCVNYSDGVEVTILDVPGVAELAGENISDNLGVCSSLMTCSRR